MVSISRILHMKKSMRRQLHPEGKQLSNTCQKVSFSNKKETLKPRD